MAQTKHSRVRFGLSLFSATRRRNKGGENCTLPLLPLCCEVVEVNALFLVVVSRAFQILSDSNKRAIYDKYGGDPESRTSTASPDSPFGNGFRGFARRPARGPMFDDEISPEELFNRFFGGGGGFTPFGRHHSFYRNPTYMQSQF